MNNWLIRKKPILNKLKSYSSRIELNGEFIFFYEIESGKIYYNEKTNSGIFIFGDILPRLGFNSGNQLSPKNLFNLLKTQPDIIIDNFKGAFTIVLLIEGSFKIFNDHLGVYKYFYNDTLDCFSNQIKEVKLSTACKISKPNCLEYFVFNYNLNGNTFYNSILYSTPALQVEYKNGRLVKSAYFDIIDFLENTKHENSSVEEIENLWFTILKQYANLLNEKHLALTLTAGLDSRIILGGIKQLRYSNYSTFTFGHQDSSDVIYAKRLAKGIGIPHNHFYPDQAFFNDFKIIAADTFVTGQTLVSLFRAHRMDAYKKVANYSSAVMMGMAGSDIVRGTGYDGLIVSPIAYHCWSNKGFNDFFDNPIYINNLKMKGFTDLSAIISNKSEYWYITNPAHYLLKVIIPLHFSQDIILMLNNNIKVYLPFIDLDYLAFINGTGYFMTNDYKSYKIMDIKKRMKGLVYSARLAGVLDNEIARYSLGKGYSAQDLINNKYLAFSKGLIYKIINMNKKYAPNFTYEEWFWKFLMNYYESDMDYLEDDILLQMQKRLKSFQKKGGELDFLDFVKFINIDMAVKL